MSCMNGPIRSFRIAAARIAVTVAFCMLLGGCFSETYQRGYIVPEVALEQRSIGFMPQRVVDQRVVAVYFDKNRRVERLANYGLKDGKVFDFVSRATPTGGKDVAYLNALFKIF